MSMSTPIADVDADAEIGFVVGDSASCSESDSACARTRCLGLGLELRSAGLAVLPSCQPLGARSAPERWRRERIEFQGGDRRRPSVTDPARCWA